MSEHTPGPWTTDGEELRMLVRGADMTIVAVRHRLHAELNEANMRLIAAAPEMLAALKALDGQPIDDEQRVLVEAAIDKACPVPVTPTNPSST